MRLRLGIVVIGRNEGERLSRCLASLARGPGRVVYVDSGSTDDSVARARAHSAAVVELDPARPFTAARGRNAGFAHLLELEPELELVQFIDGDCELDASWLPAASDYLRAHEDVGVVCGRRRERAPDRSLYNRLADIEWDTPIGDTDACGGDALMRVTAVRAATGYDESLIAGEDPEFCHRIRRLGFRIVRLDREMTLHDAAMYRFAQWWRRQSRSGHAYAELVHLHRDAPDPRRVRRVASILFWALGLPIVAIAAAPFTRGASLALLLAAYGYSFARTLTGERRRGRPLGDAARWAMACVVAKFAELSGVATFAWNRLLRGRSSRLIEYKGPESASADSSSHSS